MTSREFILPYFFREKFPNVKTSSIYNNPFFVIVPFYLKIMLYPIS